MAEAAGAAPVLDKKKSIILGLIGLAVIVVIFVRVIPQIGSYQDALTSLQAMTLGALVLIAVSVVLYLVVYGFPFMAATPGLSYWRVAAAQPGGVRDQQRGPGRRGVRPGRAVRDARVVRRRAHRQHRGDRLGRCLEHLRHARPADPGGRGDRAVGSGRRLVRVARRPGSAHPGRGHRAVRPRGPQRRHRPVAGEARQRARAAVPAPVRQGPPAGPGAGDPEVPIGHRRPREPALGRDHRRPARACRSPSS